MVESELYIKTLGAFALCYLLYDILRHLTWPSGIALLLASLIYIHNQKQQHDEDEDEYENEDEDDFLEPDREETTEKAIIPEKSRSLKQRKGKLTICNLLNSTSSPFLPNAEEPIPFETAHFRGKILFLLRKPPSSKWKHLFAGKRRLFWIQLQGQFKTAPVGTVYIGGEVPHPMKLGILTRPLCKAILGILKSLVQGLHYSFGDESTDLPHICFPLYNAVDEFICTKAGEKPPNLGEDGFGEPSLDRKQRKKDCSLEQPHRFNTTDTYTFQFHSYFVDFDKWRVVNVAGLADFDLRTVWNGMPLRIVAYEPNPAKAAKSSEGLVDASKGLHTENENRYFLRFELNHRHFTKSSRSRDQLVSVPKDELDVSNSSRNIMKSSAEKLDQIKFCIPYWVEYYNSYTNDSNVGYIFHVVENNNDEDVKCWSILHTLAQASAPIVSVSTKLKDKVKKSRRYRAEWERALVEEKLLQLARSKDIPSKSSLYSLLTSRPEANNDEETSIRSERQFFHDCFFSEFGSRSPGQLKISLPQRQPSVKSEVLRFVWDSYLRHEYLILGNVGEFQFYGGGSSSPTLVIEQSDVIFVSIVDEKLIKSPFFDMPELKLLKLETLERVHWFIVSSVTEAEKWINCLKPNNLLPKLMQQPFATTLSSYTSIPFVDEEIQSKYKDNRRILNTRQTLGAKSLHSDLGQPTIQNPCTYIAKTLRQALTIDPQNTKTTEVLQFFDACSLLKCIDTTPLKNSPNHIAAFFLNLYHLIVLHANILQMLPTSKLFWSPFFNEVSYEIGPHVFSLAEIEHCVLKSKMHSPKIPFVSLILPIFESSDPRAVFQWNQKDFRINLALNCMSLSCVDRIFVYSPDVMDELLNLVCAIVLKECMEIDSSKLIVYLPKVCEWYRNDFGENGIDTLRKLIPFLEGTQLDQIRKIVLNEKKTVKVKYLGYNFGFRGMMKEVKVQQPSQRGLIVC